MSVVEACGMCKMPVQGRNSCCAPGSLVYLIDAEDVVSLGDFSMQGLGQHPAARRHAHSSPWEELLVSDSSQPQGAPGQDQQWRECRAQPSIRTLHQHPAVSAAR